MIAGFAVECRAKARRYVAEREESPDTVLRHVDRSAFILTTGANQHTVECRASR